MDLDGLAALFLDDRVSYCSSRTVADYREKLRRFLGFAPADAGQLPADTLRSYIRMLRGTGVGDSTVRSYYRPVRAFCGWLHREGHIPVDVTGGVRLPGGGAAPVVPLTMDGAARADAVPGARDRLILHLMLDAGLRSGEACRLTHGDVRLDTGILVIRDSKCGKSRIVPIAPVLRRLLLAYCPEAPHARPPAHAPLLTMRHTAFDAPGGMPLTPNGIKLAFARARRRSGVTRLHAHLCRHTFATSYIMGGGNLETLRLLPGHSDYNVTRGYLHLAAQYGIVHYPIYRLDAVFFQKGYG